MTTVRQELKYLFELGNAPQQATGMLQLDVSE
jgi:hypothetical protein